MADRQEVTRIRAYVKRHSDNYSPAALRQKLLADGYDPQAVELVLAGRDDLRAEDARKRFFWGTLLATPLFNLLMLVTACDYVIWILFGQGLTLAGMVGAGGDAEDRATGQAVGRGCGLGILASLVMVLVWFRFVAC